MKRPLILLLATLLSGCNLLGDALNVVTPKPGSLGVALQAPGGTTATVVVAGAGTEKTFSDDGRGFAVKLEAKPGDYTLTPSTVSGFEARLAITTKDGNSTVSGSARVTVSSGGDAAVVISYVAR
jgi:hypothetical protein